jgi:outer membrane receptor protein involved in Fe transport
MPRHFSWTLWLLLLTSVPPVNAAPISPQASDARTLYDELGGMTLEQLMQLVITPSRTPEQSRHAPGTVRVITRKEIRDRGYIHLGDLVFDLPGFDVQNYTNPVTFNSVTVRGLFGAERLLILRDGIRVTSPLGGYLTIYERFPLYDAERVEILYGPSSGIYGQDAFSGVVNIITTTADGEPAGDAQIIGGDFDYKYASVTKRYEIGEELSFQLGGHWQEADNPNLAAIYPNDFEITDLVTFDGRTVLDADERRGYASPTRSGTFSTRLDLGERFSVGMHYGRQRHSTTIGRPPSAVNYNNRPYWDFDNLTAFTTYRDSLTPNITSDLQATYTRYEVDPNSRYADVFNDYEDAYKYSHSWQAALTHQLDIALPDGFQVIAGYSLVREIALPITTDLEVPFDPGRDPSGQPLFYPNTDQQLRAKVFQLDYNSYGMYVQGSKEWNTALRTIAGIRFDDSTRHRHSVNPRAALIWDASRLITFKLLYGEAFLGPSPQKQYEHFGTFSGRKNEEGEYVSSLFHIPNPSLGPETVRTVEASMLVNPGNTSLLTVSAYHSELSDLTMAAPTETPQTDYIPGGFIETTQTYRNVGSTEVHGVDVSLDHHTNTALGDVRAWSHYSFVDGRLTAPQGTFALPFVSKHKVKVGLTYDYDDRYFLSPSLYWISRATTHTFTSRNTKASSYFLTNLVGGVRNIAEGLDLTVRVDNVFNRKYYHAGFGSFPDFLNSPQDPRTFKVILNYRF